MWCEGNGSHLIKADSLDYIGVQSGSLNMAGFYKPATALELQAAGIKAFR